MSNHPFKNFSFLLCFVSSLSWALSPEVEDIFNKSNRRLRPPPKTLRADKAALDYRYSTAKERDEALNSKASRYEDIKATDKVPDNTSLNKPLRSPEPNEDLTLESEPVKSPLSQENYSESSFGGKKRRKSLTNFNGERIFGFGFVGGGAYGIFGVEADFTVSPQWSAGLGVGTGMSYSTWSAYGRYYFKESTWSPFFQAGYANWFLQRVSKTGQGLSPEYLAERFFQDGSGKIQEGERLHLVYPALGVLYQSPTGFAISVQLQYFISLNGFTGGLYGDTGFHYYF